MSFHKDRVTIYDVARRAGVSPATVSRVINKRGNVRPDTEKKVLTAVKESRFSPNQIARTLPMRTSRTIGLVAESLYTPYFSRFAHELDCACAARGYALIIGLTGSDEADSRREQQVLADFVKRQVDGFVILGGRSNFSKVSTSFKRDVEEIGSQLPLVFVNCGYGFDDCSHVGTDESEAFGQVMDHLLERGHRRIALISGTAGKWTNDKKIAAYRKKMEEAGGLYSPGLIRQGIHTVESGKKSAQALLEEDRSITALACTNDILAIGALQGVTSLGLSVPEDISVTGFDDIEPASYLTPGITTFAQDYAALAHESLGIILDRAEGDTAPRHISLEGRLTLRNSTGFIRSDS
ncbi:MAG: LacI family DNA-binding transcriptional regulator [Spirochaetales bacterium]|nr:LacI family DNA-binding transcriptional regulator [Spirochaetales bacterium]